MEPNNQENLQEKKDSLSLQPSPVPENNVEKEKNQEDKDRQKEKKEKKKSVRDALLEKMSPQQRKVFKQQETLSKARSGDILTYPTGTKYMKTKEGTLVNINKDRLSKKEKKRLKRQRRKERGLQK